MSMTGCHTIDDPGFRFLRLRAPFPTMTDAHTKLFRERSRIRVLGFQFSLSPVPGYEPVLYCSTPVMCPVAVATDVSVSGTLSLKPRADQIYPVTNTGTEH